MTLILASQSQARQAMLHAAGVSFTSATALIDEDALKAGLRAQGTTPRNLADALAEAKALRLSQKSPTALVLGCDQTLAVDGWDFFDKAVSRDQLAEQLTFLSGKTHTLTSAAVIVLGGQPIWRFVDRVKMTMRALSPAFIDDYVAREGDHVLGCLGGYQIEANGAQLFARIEGSHFTIMGLPLLPLLDFLRVRGELPA